MDTFEKCAEEIMKDLSDRRGLRQALDECDEDVRQEIRDAFASIIRQYCAPKWIDGPPKEAGNYWLRGILENTDDTDATTGEYKWIDNLSVYPAHIVTARYGVLSKTSILFHCPIQTPN